MAVLARNWWAVGLRGLIAILFGLAALFWPGITLFAPVFLFGVYALVDGVLSIVAAFRAAEHHTRWWPLLLVGLAGIAAGLLTFFYPGVTAIALLYIIAAWAIVTGILEIIAAFQLHREISNEWLLGLSGLAAVIFGILATLMPGAGALAIVWLIGIYAVIFGVLQLWLAYRLRNLESSLTRRPGAPGSPAA
jgi:uncharacterized membrane protein HdeD (DUF308 family)